MKRSNFMMIKAHNPIRLHTDIIRLQSEALAMRRSGPDNPSNESGT